MSPTHPIAVRTRRIPFFAAIAMAIVARAFPRCGEATRLRAACCQASCDRHGCFNATQRAPQVLGCHIHHEALLALLGHGDEEVAGRVGGHEKRRRAFWLGGVWRVVCFRDCGSTCRGPLRPQASSARTHPRGRPGRMPSCAPGRLPGRRPGPGPSTSADRIPPHC